MEKFIKELEVGEIYHRDKWQFELKSEFIPHRGVKKNLYSQEFYFFIPNSLQINEETYPKSQFYQDQTNLIRYKTPEFTLYELTDGLNSKSPLTRLEKLRYNEPTKETIPIVKNELKLLANIARSAIRQVVGKIVKKNLESQTLEIQIDAFCENLAEFRNRYSSIQSDFIKKWTSITQKSHFLYIDEFISETIDYYLIGIIDSLSQSKPQNYKAMIEKVSKVIAHEKKYRENVLKKPSISTEDNSENEHILYTKSLLNKFVLDALLLNTTKASVLSRFQNLIGSLAAAIAMLFFFVLFTKQSNVLIINSVPFIVLTVILYVLKDRIKESLKNLSYSQFAKWFSDYKTEIFSPDGSKVLGQMREYVSFIKEKELPNDIKKIRNREFHVVLEAFKRPEQILYYKKQIKLCLRKEFDVRRQALSIMFRFHLQNFLQKASNSYRSYTTFNPNTLELCHTNLPKVYHLNIIMKNTYTKNGKKQFELKKFRLILDKDGIKRVEHIPH